MFEIRRSALVRTSRFFGFSLSASKIRFSAIVTVTPSQRCEVGLELRCDWLRSRQVSAGHVLRVQVPILTVLALVQSLSRRLFATFLLVRLSACVFVVS